MDGVLKPPQIIFDCDNFVDSTDKDQYTSILSDLISQDTTYALHNIIPSQCEISKISLTKILIEFKENSLFENKVTDLNTLCDTLNNILIYRDALVTTSIIPRKIVYKDFEVILVNIDSNLRKDRLTEIISKRVKHYYHNALLLWTAVKLIENKYIFNNINLENFYMELSPNISINLDEFQLSIDQDLTANSSIDDIKSWTFNTKTNFSQLS